LVIVEPGLQVLAHVALVRHDVASVGHMVAHLGFVEDPRRILEAFGMRSFSDFDGRLPCVECPLTIGGSAVALVCITTSWAVLGLSARLLHEFPFPTPRTRPRSYRRDL